MIFNILKKIPFVSAKIKKLKGLSIYEILKESINTQNPNIIDIGANKGQTIENFISLFENPSIYSFEPTPNLFFELQEKYKENKKVNLYNYALNNSKGKETFFVSNFSPTNSLLKPNIELYKEIEASTKVGHTLTNTFRKSLNTIEVSTIRFDNWYYENLSNNVIDIFKTDTQGNDLEVLMGAEKVLGSIKIIIIECQFQEFYRGSKPFYKIFEFLYNNGFYLYNIDKNNKSVQIHECDAIFINKIFSN